MRQIKVEMQVKLPLKFTKRKKWVLASCPVLDLHSQGETEAQAKKNLRDTISLFLISCFERGTLDAVLKSAGFTAQHDTLPASHKKPAPPADYINVPMPFVCDMANKHQCHA